MTAVTIALAVALAGTAACTTAAPLSLERDFVMVFLQEDGSFILEGRSVDATELSRIAAGRPAGLRAQADSTFPNFMKAVSDLEELGVPVGLIGEDIQ